MTEPVVNVIDTTPPACTVDPLPSEVPVSDFALSWTGSDAVGEIDKLTVFVSVDEGGFAPFVQDTEAASATFSGEAGRRYQFFRVAVDTAGNVEAQTPIAEAETQVAGAALSSDFTTVSSASFFVESPVSPESIASGFGRDVSLGTESAAAIPLPTSLAGTTVTVRDSQGIERLAPLFFVSPGQLNFFIAAGTATGLAVLTVRIDGQEVALGNVAIQYISPGLFSANGDGQGVAAAIALRVEPDGSRSEQFVFDAAPAKGSRAAVPIDLGPEGDEIFLVLFGTGIRGFVSEVSATVGGIDVPVLAAVAQGQFVGLDQVNVGPLPRALAGRGVT